MMKICAMTMVYRDYWALSRWYAHHGAQLGHENLFVVSHGLDPKIAEICPKASVITVPREDLTHFDRARAQMLDGFFAGLAQVYDWVIRTDADELLCFDPELYPSLPEAIHAHKDSPVLTALGFDLVESPDDEALSDTPVFGQRRNLAFSGHYSKAVAARRAIPFQLHGVRVASKRLETFPFSLPKGLFLAHLKFANHTVLTKVNKVREAVGNAEFDGVPGAGWKQASQDSMMFLANFWDKPLTPWNQAYEHAFATLSVKPQRHEKFSVVKTRALKMPHRTLLPDRFAFQG
jgi:hypothetical protein